MSLSKQEKMDTEQKDKIDVLAHSYNSGKSINFSDIFSHKSIKKNIESQKIIIPTFDLNQIKINFPFSKALYVVICPKCNCVSNLKNLEILLDHHAITPILAGEYREYPKKFIDIMVGYPHISMHEYMFYRFVKLLRNSSSALCTHCVDNRQRDIIKLLEKKNIHPKAYKIVEELIWNLTPCVESDSELIEDFYGAVKKDNVDQIFQILELSRALQDIRTIQAFNSRSTIPLDNFSQIVNNLKRKPDMFSIDNTLREEVSSKVVHLTIPTNLPLNQYLEAIEPFRSGLSKVIESILEESKLDKGASYTKLETRISELSENLFRLPRNKRFLFYNAGVAFVKSNKSILAASLAAGLLGLTGSLIGCGLSVAGGIGVQVLKRYSKIKVPTEFQKLSAELSYSIRPSILKLMAKSLRLDIQAVQLWNIKNNLSSYERKLKNK